MRRLRQVSCGCSHPLAQEVGHPQIQLIYHPEREWDGGRERLEGESKEGEVDIERAERAQSVGEKREGERVRESERVTVRVRESEREI